MNKFYQLSIEERIASLVGKDIINSDEAKLLEDNISEEDVENSISENVIGKFNLPFSVIESVNINNKEYTVPMAIEEPSVVAAAANGVKRVKNFETTILNKEIIGQIVWKSNDKNLAINLANEQKYIEQLISESRPSLIKRGGGLTEIKVNQYDGFIELLLFINTVDAMGANIVNSICENVAAKLDKKYLVDHLIAILSNDGSQQLLKVEVNVSFDQLETKNLVGKEVAEKIVTLSDFTQLSKYRASTNNKGILNGIFAVAQASGNDTRAISAALMNYAKSHQSLSKWDIIDNNLHGELVIPLPVGSVGGAISSMPMAKLAMKILQVKDVKEFMSVIASVGLANNLSAMRALVTSGIQQGHMSLQSKSLAVAAGAEDFEILSVSKKLNEIKKYDLSTAKEILKELRNN